MKYLTRNMGFLYKTYFAMLQTATSLNATECDTSKYGFLMSTISQIRETQVCLYEPIEVCRRESQ